MSSAQGRPRLVVKKVLSRPKVTRIFDAHSYGRISYKARKGYRQKGDMQMRLDRIFIDKRA